VKVNGWANGWLIDNAKVQGTSLNIEDESASLDSSAELQNDEVRGGESAELTDTTLSVVIIYWPQYLEWVGLGVLVLTLGYLGFVVIREKGK
jgi:hypothetical protein